MGSPRRPTVKQQLGFAVVLASAIALVVAYSETAPPGHLDDCAVTSVESHKSGRYVYSLRVESSCGTHQAGLSLRGAIVTGGTYDFETKGWPWDKPRITGIFSVSGGP